MTTGRYTICMGCARRGKPDGVGDQCEAFSEGIPDEILNGGYDHREAFEGDHGLRFVQVEGMEEVTARYDQARLADEEGPSPYL